MKQVFNVSSMSMHFSEKTLATLVPSAKISAKNVNWANRITAQYRHYSMTMQNRDRSAVVSMSKLKG